MATAGGVVARSLRDVARGRRVESLLLRKSQDLICKNLMCEHVGSSCACKLSLVLERVPELRVMDLSANQLRFLPASTFALTKLVDLNVSKNELQALPNELGKLKELRVLDISHNRIATIPQELIGEMKSLEEIRVTGNPVPSETIAALQSHYQHIKLVE